MLRISDVFRLLDRNSTGSWPMLIASCVCHMHSCRFKTHVEHRVSSTKSPEYRGRAGGVLGCRCYDLNCTCDTIVQICECITEKYAGLKHMWSTAPVKPRVVNTDVGSGVVAHRMQLMQFNHTQDTF